MATLINGKKESRREALKRYQMWVKEIRMAPDQFLEDGIFIHSSLEPPDGYILVDMSKDIWDLAQNEKPTIVDFATKINVWRSLNEHFKIHLPKYGVFPIGSTLNGFGLKSCEADFVMLAYISKGIRKSHFLLRKHLQTIRAKLNENVFVKKNQIYPGQLAYYIAFQETFSNLKVNMVLNSFTSIRSTHLLFHYTKVDWRVQPLGIVLKLFGKNQKILGTRPDSFTSYHLILMLIYFLQNEVKPAVLPCLQRLCRDKFFVPRAVNFTRIDYFKKYDYNFCSKNQQTLEQLLIEFFQFALKFNYKCNVISVRLGTAIRIDKETLNKKLLKTASSSFLKIEEPFDKGNITAKVTEKNFANIQTYFKAAAERLELTSDVHTILQPFNN